MIVLPSGPSWGVGEPGLGRIFCRIVQANHLGQSFSYFWVLWWPQLLVELCPQLLVELCLLLIEMQGKPRNQRGPCSWNLLHILFLELRGGGRETKNLFEMVLNQFEVFFLIFKHRLTIGLDEEGDEVTSLFLFEKLIHSIGSSIFFVHQSLKNSLSWE